MAATGSKIATLVLRVLTFILLFISLLVLATATSQTIIINGAAEKIKFKDFSALKYMMAAIIIGAALNLLQIAFNVYGLVMKGDGNILFDFFTNTLMSYLLLSGAVAGLGAGVDLKSVSTVFFQSVFNSFFDKTNGAAAIVFIAFFFSAIVSVISFLTGFKKP